MERLFPVCSSHPRDVDDPYKYVDFDTDTLEDDEVYVVINMVSSIDGRVEVDGKSGAIGSDVDRRAMRTLRSRVDGVMVGSGTLRAEKVSLTSEGKSSPEPYAVIPTSDLDLPLARNLKDNDPERTIILTTTRAMQEKQRSDPEGFDAIKARGVLTPCRETDKGRPDLTHAMKLLRKRHGIRTLLLEGGPSLNSTMVSSGLVRELFLTLSPKLLGGSQENALNILSGKTLENTKATTIHIHRSDTTSELFFRFRLDHPPLQVSSE